MGSLFKYITLPVIGIYTAIYLHINITGRYLIQFNSNSHVIQLLEYYFSESFVPKYIEH